MIEGHRGSPDLSAKSDYRWSQPLAHRKMTTTQTSLPSSSPDGGASEQSQGLRRSTTKTVDPGHLVTFLREIRAQRNTGE